MGSSGLRGDLQAVQATEPSTRGIRSETDQRTERIKAGSREREGGESQTMVPDLWPTISDP